MNNACRHRLLTCLVLFLLTSAGHRLAAEVRLPGFFGDHMVLQRGMELKFWGWADEGESVEVQLGEQTAKTSAGSDGRWELTLPAHEASVEPLVLTVVGSNTIEITDVLVGEVWLCSGQSNMEWTVQRSTNAEQEIAAADFPMIRHIKVPRRPSPTPLDDIDSEWQVCSSETVANFTAAGYFMARELHQELDVPIGLINSSWGGTRVEPWTPPVGFARVDALESIYKSVMGRTPGTTPFENRLGKFIEATESWMTEAQMALENDTPVSPSPSFPDELKPFQRHQDPTMLYNGMIHALVGFPIRGAIWYQGEANRGDGMMYFEKKKALIGGWRELWDQGDFPFYYVQIAPYQYGNDDPTQLARFWEAQAAVQQIPNTAMVVTNDIATLDNIHPPNKQDVGRRLALLALKHDYGRSEVVAHSPSMNSLEVLDGRIRIKFDHTAGDLKTRDGAPPTHFELIGPGSRGYQKATAIIDGDAVIVSSESVAKPTAVRFAWNKLAQPNLVGGSGLPVAAFRGGEEPDFVSMLGIEHDYQLVYDIDLGRLGESNPYDVDHSDQSIEFDRVGYLVELRSESGDQKVFVSMAAFSDDLHNIGIPTSSSDAAFQQTVDDMQVSSNVDGLSTESTVASGNIEFWPNNYSPRNAADVPNAASNLFDFGDEPGPPRNGYGSMQVHNHGTGQTIFAINHWNAGDGADLGIGNSDGENPDWTFAGNAKDYSRKRLRVYVRPAKD